MSLFPRALWPFRIGSDESFGGLDARSAHSRVSSRGGNDGVAYAGSTVNLYDEIKAHPPVRSFDDELQRYTMWRRQRGLLQSIVPTTACGGGIGFVFGVAASRMQGRYMGRVSIIARYTSTFALVAAVTAAVHTALLLRSNFEDTLFYPFIAGTASSLALPYMTSTGTMHKMVLSSALVGFVYVVYCVGSQWWRDRAMRLFLLEQKQKHTPPHRIAPELQVLYRAFLYDTRPLEERPIHQRHLSLLRAHRDEHDIRLDAEYVMQNMVPEVWYWINFPPWWPFKVQQQTDTDVFLLKRISDDKVTHAVRSMFTDRDSHDRPAPTRVGGAS